ncbi:adenosylcobinamide amidohydrolase [Planomonospora sphaerica]|uniref:Adenosylcobinamide amidohydrolase n=1 Tax=Planomonospora sphaerica TaxID=161355 RepID=A0A161MAD4_9ACTN|nr:adenosylcobinamide amidohydrolase [Planomonospora sphaerica]GAT66603.1 adenosylcobinamide amidohydrolase [Planomonospora sphaerica]
MTPSPPHPAPEALLAPRPPEPAGPGSGRDGAGPGAPRRGGRDGVRAEAAGRGRLAGGSFELSHRREDGVRLASLLWRPGPGWRAISSAMVGGGIGPVEWVLNAQVPGGYARMDPVDHLREMAPAGPGVGMLTAAAVDRFTRAADGGAEAVATVGLRVPTWAAAPEGVPDPELAPLYRPGTINIIVAVPVPVSDAALVNLVMTVTEAKTQALVEEGFGCTGTASDAVCVAAPEAGPGDAPGELFGGPRSVWGARAARAVHRAVRQGARDWAGRDGSAT